MRFKKGSKIEVFNETELPVGSWQCAEIISGNGRHYYVRYGCYQTDTEPAVERVPRKVIRPCPPALKGLGTWVPGDIVEVFDSHNSSWKIAEVSKAGSGDCYLIRHLGLLTEHCIHSSNIRSRQLWHDDKWTVIQKDSRKCGVGAINRFSKKGDCRNPQPHMLLKSCAQDGHLKIENDVLEALPPVSKRDMKKRPRVETCNEARRKRRSIEREGRYHHLVAACSSNVRQKVDAVASPQPMLGEKYMHASLNNKKTGPPNVNRGGGIMGNDESYHITSLEPNDTASITSSVGSCSPCSSPYRPVDHPGSGLIQDVDSSFDVASSSSSYGREPSLPTQEASEEEIHQLELHAYRATMVALYNSGPLTWDQEGLMTNLRLSLNISNDEHLSELRNLVSTEKDASFR